MMMVRTITITGPIGTGATTLAKRLIEVVPTWETFFRDDVESTNPFFSPYHIDPARYSFHNQVTFLTSSAECHCHLSNLAKAGKVYVQDFSPFEHTEVYAYVQYQFGLLSQEEYQMLSRLTKVIEPSYSSRQFWYIVL